MDQVYVLYLLCSVLANMPYPSSVIELGQKMSYTTAKVHDQPLMTKLLWSNVVGAVEPSRKDDDRSARPDKENLPGDSVCLRAEWAPRRSSSYP